MRVLSTVKELDEALRQVADAGKVSDEAMRQAFGTFRMEHTTPPRFDPHSEEYRLAELARYREISGRPDTTTNRVSPVIDVGSAAARPYPYYSGSCAAVGNELLSVAHAIRRLDLEPRSTVLEFGSGWGNTTIALAMSGLRVIAVEADPTFCEVIRRRAAMSQVEVEVVNDDFSYLERLKDPVDAVLFYECFHRAPDHQAVLRGLDGAIRPGGKAVFASEPISTDFPAPWGLRMDGESLWAMRQNGWLELGFRENYFVDALGRAGWGVRKHELPNLPSAACFEATRRKVWSLKYFGSSPELHSKAGTRTKSTMRVKAQKPGHFLYGPWAGLPSGRWKAALTLRGLSGGRPTGVCLMDVASGDQVFAARELQLNALPEGPVVLPFDLSAHASALEVRLFSNEPVEVEIVQLDISPN